MIKVENLAFSYKRKQTLFQDFSYTLQPGGVYGLLGRNGAGKSTLLQLMAGLLIPTRGNVRFHGVEVSKRLPSLMSELFFVPEEFELPSVSLSDYMRLMSGFYPRFSVSDFRKYLSVFELSEDIHLGSLSMGQRKKVFISFAMATNTSVLLMDEPTNGLDISGKRQFRKIMASGIDENRTLMISTHQVRDVERLLDRVAILEGNRMLLDESVSTICDKLYFTEVEQRDEVQGAIATMPSLRGSYVMLSNDEGRESDLNLELLYEGALAHPELISTMFQK